LWAFITQASKDITYLNTTDIKILEDLSL
jgi:hypothetical protein